MSKFRPRITREEFDVVAQYRAIKNKANELGLDDKDVKHGWLKTNDASLFFRNPSFGNDFDIKNIDFKALIKDAPKLEI